MGIDIIDRPGGCGKGQSDAAGGSFSGGRNHFMTVRRGPVPDQLPVNFRFALPGMLKFFQQHNPGPVRHDKSVPIHIIGP